MLVKYYQCHQHYHHLDNSSYCDLTLTVAASSLSPALNHRCCSNHRYCNCRYHCHTCCTMVFDEDVVSLEFVPLLLLLLLLTLVLPSPAVLPFLLPAVLPSPAVLPLLLTLLLPSQAVQALLLTLGQQPHSQNVLVDSGFVYASKVGGKGFCLHLAFFDESPVCLGFALLIESIKGKGFCFRRTRWARLGTCNCVGMTNACGVATLQLPDK
jgi:hypothetical protein